jgi:DNA replication ATP-dependent helicase Dna2
MMVLYDVKTGKPATGAHSEDCFLCILDSQSCAVKELEGYIIHAQEVRSKGEVVPFVTINLGTELAALTLTHYYRRLIQGLADLGPDLHKRKLRLRVYHLPPAIRTTENKGRLVHRYRATDHTLAVLEPDTVLNITDLSHAEYCARQYLLQRLIASPPSTAAIRGNLVHYSFREFLKERTKRVPGGSANDGETPLATLQRHFEQALESSSIDLAFANASPDEIRTDVAPHLESLGAWFQKQYGTLWDMPDTESTGVDRQRNENGVRAETFLLAPEIGLRGRVDLLWKQTGRQRLLELKTGGAKGELPNPSHRWQVQGYHALLAVRRDPRMKKAFAALLYSGTPGEAQDFQILFTARQFQKVIEHRNKLVLSHVTGKAPAPPGPSRCTKCAMLAQCIQVSSLLDWQPPEPETRVNSNAISSSAIASVANSDILEMNGLHRPVVQPQDRHFFSKYYELLRLEERESEKQLALLWKMPVKERIEQGAAIDNIYLLEQEPTEQGEWEQTFACKNTSELREGDEILLSDDNPISGEVVTGTIIRISSEQVRVWTRELIAHPRLIDRYDNSIVHIRTLQNLMRWLQTGKHLRELVAASARPHFDTIAVTPRTDFNAQQNLAVERALQMRDYLLIHGPPGTGKTSVVAEIVKRLCRQGQRVMLAAFTNQAVDNVLRRLDAEGFHDYVRLGHERSTDEAVKGHLLQRLVEEDVRCSGAPGDRQVSHLQALRQILRKASVVASTTATWSSDKHDLSTVAEGETNREESLLQFDVAIIDEAGQLTVPAILGALRFAKRFVLVGDEKQLPPLVLSKEAQEKGLSESLFEQLKRLDDDYINNHPEATSACVPLTVQYRMNRWISHFASHIFYGGKLIPHDSVAHAVLRLVEPAVKFNEEPPSILHAIDPANPMVFLDVRGGQEGIKMSNSEACAVREVVAGLLVRGIAPEDIGIIAPFRAQVANLRRHLLDDDLPQWPSSVKNVGIHGISIDTVDRFQGGERQVIIISFATTTAPEIGSQLREHLTNPHRLNVALTRAQKKLILVGSAPALEQLPVFASLLTYCRELQAVITHVPLKSR